MTSLFEAVVGDSYTTVSKDANHNIRHRSYRHVLKSKENTYTNKCKKILKRKLKKYKLRQDGKEDPDIIDVSDLLVKSLFIRSPNKIKDSVELELEELQPKNYLFRMVRRKQTNLNTVKVSHSSDNRIKTLKENAETPKSPSMEEKKQTNAFKLLMESRNKSLGTNSPGKEKPKDELEQNEISEIKSIKAKRNLMLQKMAEEKGSLKKKVTEEQEDKYIKKKMEKRAEKLKSMILNKEPKTVAVKDKNEPVSQKVRSPLDSIDTEKNGKVSDKSLGTLQLVNMFNEVDNKVVNKRKIISKEDEEFLQKLSPSIRKKESMLCYFKKIEKDQDSSNIDAESSNENDNVIKVKFPKLKKRGRKKKLSLNRDSEDKTDVLIIEQQQVTTDIKEPQTTTTEQKQLIELESIEVTNNDIKDEKSQVKTSLPETSVERKKRKREARDKSIIHENPNDERPRRTVRKPVKYNEDVVLSSSDEELHIFTPKKKKHESRNKPTKIDITLIQDDKDIKDTVDKKSSISENHSIKEKKPTKNVNPSKVVKLAPIFSKAQPDAAAIEAKQKFLQSGVPEQLKKLMAKQKSSCTYNNYFPIVVHVQQLESSCNIAPAMNLLKETNSEDFKINHLEDIFIKMLDLSTSPSTVSVQSKNSMNILMVLQNLKESYPRFPVYRIYKLLRGKKKGEYKNSDIFSNLDNSVEILNCSIDMQNDNPDQLSWTDKYKAVTGNEIIGNFDSIKEMKKWLVTWTENETKSKMTNSIDSDSSDYYQSEPDSRDSMKSCNNLLVLSGPAGCGKTSSVYAVAAELSMKVIEVNASSKRTGKIMLQDLQEATQSHKVNRGTSSNDNSQKSQEIFEPLPEKEVKKRGRPKKVVDPPKKLVKEKIDVTNGLTSSQESTRTAMSLILIDDADIVFDQDDGFCSAIMQLVQCSKRPVILVTSSITLPHLQKFLHSSKMLRMQPLLPRMLGTWLDLMCLADSGLCWPGMGARILNYFKGDVRKTVNCLQFYVGSLGQSVSENNSQTNSQNSDVRVNVEDENSCMSWSDRDVIDDKNIGCDTDPQSFEATLFNEHTHLKHMKCPLKMFDVWWSIPKLLKIESHNTGGSKCTKSLESISSLLDSMSVCDYFSHLSPETESTMFSQPWYSAECDSVSELENMSSYDRKYETTKNLCHELVTGCINTAQEKMGIENIHTLDYPGMSHKRQRDRVIKRHNDLTSYLSPQSLLDRNALALDYWPSCRAICRVEKSKTDSNSNSKRNNRFCHYLKSISFLCKTESFDSLANSLNPNNI